MSLRIVLIFAFALMLVSIANAESVSIPLSTIKKPAADLLYKNAEPLDPGQAAVLSQQGLDLSLLNPADNKLWQNKKYDALDKDGSFTSQTASAFPAPNQSVQFLSHEAELSFTYMARVQVPGLGAYRLTLSRLSHSALMRAALMRKLGYYLPSPRYYPRLTIQFSSEAQKMEFLKISQEAMISDFESRNWIISQDSQAHTLTMADVVLEIPDSQYFDAFWGYAPNPKDPNQLATVQRFSRYRAYRALVLPFAIPDVPESVNRYSPQMLQILSGYVVIQHPSAESFSAVSYEDAKWLARRIAQLTPKDWREIVDAAAWPKEIDELVYRKMLYRVRTLLEAFSLGFQDPALQGDLPTLDYSSPSGLIQKGKVTKEFVPGFPQRFSHGDRESPFKDGDLWRYANIRGKSSVIATAIDELNKKIQILKFDQAISKRKDEIRNRIMDHIRNHPREPLYQNVESWGGPLMGFNLAATRNVSTGTYFGSSAAIQLVDNLSVAAQLGYFWTWDGVPKGTPMAGGNVAVLRDYTHVRPLLSIKEGTAQAWSDLILPRFMDKLSSVLRDEIIVKNQDGVQLRQSSVDSFLKELREGEVFTITDSVALSTYIQMNSSLDVLMGIAPLSFANSVSLGADASRVILSQISIMRTKEGLQVFVRKQKANAFGLSFDAQYFVKLLSIRTQTSQTDLKTDAFVIDYNPEVSSLIDSDQKDQDFVKDHLSQQTKLRPMLRALFDGGETELLYANFRYQKFEIDHQLKTQEWRKQFLWMKMAGFSESHLLKIQYPANEAYPDLNPADEAVTLYSYKKGELKGRDFLGMTLDFISALFQKAATRVQPNFGGSGDPNPANVPFGQAYWRMVNTESDLTPQNPYPSVANLQHVWGGWKLSRQDFLRLLDQIQEEFRQTPVAPYRLVPLEAFQNVKSVDFYRITANLSVLPGGIEKLRDLLLQPDATSAKTNISSNAISRFFQRLSNKLGQGGRMQDAEMFEDIMTVLGNGDLQKGKALYLQQCQQLQMKNSGEVGSMDPTPVIIQGYRYDCMMPWFEKLRSLAAQYPSNKMDRTRWMSEVLFVLDEQIPLPQILKLLGNENFIFVVRINGFRTGDEDGDLEFFSNSIGDPKQEIQYANGLINMFANKTRISPIELDRTQGGFR